MAPICVLVFRPARAFVLGNPACLCPKFRFWCFADNAWNRRNALKVFFVRGDLSIENKWILQNDKRRCMEVHKVRNTRQVPCSPWNIAEHRYRSNVHSLRAVHLHIGGRSRGQNHWSWKQLTVFSLTWSLRRKYFAVKSVICRCDSVNDCERFAPYIYMCIYIYVYVYIYIYIRFIYSIKYIVVIAAIVVLFPIFDVWKHVERFEKGPVSGASSPAPELELTAKRCKRVSCQSQSEK